MNNYYYRDIKVPFNTLYFNKKNILTRSETVLNFYEKIIVSEKCIENIFIVVGYWVNQLQGQRNGQSFQFPFKGKVNI